MKVKSESEFTQSCPTLSDPMDCSLPGFSVHRVFQARVLKWGATAFSNPYMTTVKTIALTRWTLVDKVMSLLFNMLSRLDIAFLPRSKHLLISWLQSSSAVILEPKKLKSLTVSIISPSICHEVMEPNAMILVFLMLSFKPTFHFPLSLSSRLKTLARSCFVLMLPLMTHSGHTQPLLCPEFWSVVFFDLNMCLSSSQNYSR